MFYFHSFVDPSGYSPHSQRDHSPLKMETRLLQVLAFVLGVRWGWAHRTQLVVTHLNWVKNFNSSESDMAWLRSLSTFSTIMIAGLEPRRMQTNLRTYSSLARKASKFQPHKLLLISHRVCREGSLHELGATAWSMAGESLPSAYIHVQAQEYRMGDLPRFVPCLFMAAVLYIRDNGGVLIPCLSCKGRRLYRAGSYSNHMSLWSRVNRDWQAMPVNFMSYGGQVESDAKCFDENWVTSLANVRGSVSGVPTAEKVCLVL